MLNKVLTFLHINNFKKQAKLTIEVKDLDLAGRIIVEGLGLEKIEAKVG